MPGRELVSRWLPVAVWAALIFALSSVPSASTGLGVWDTILRKLWHVTEFAVLGVLLVRALPPLPSLYAGIAYAATDELHQHFVSGRAGTLLDVGIDAVGVAAGVLLARR